MNGGSDAESKIIKRGEDTEKLSEGRANDNGEQSVPNEKSDDGRFGNVAFLPSDFGMSEKGNDGSNDSGNEAGEPNQIVVFDDEIGKNGVEDVIKNSDANAYKKVAGGVPSCASFGSFGLVG